MRGVGRLVALQARRDRWQLLIWIGGIGLLGLAAASAVASEFGDEAERASIIAVAAANPAFLFLRGQPDGLDIGSVVFFQAYSFTAVLAGLMSSLLVTRHTRADEELGRGELIGSTVVSRTAPLLATVTLGVAANVLLAVSVTLGHWAGGLPLVGSAVVGAAVASVGLVAVGVTALLAQLLPTGRSTNGTAAALIGAAYLVRGVADALGEPNASLTRVEPAALTWLSPIGWGQATRPFSEPTLAPLALSLAAFALAAVLALALRRRRDLGSSLVPERSGRPEAGLGGHSALGLAWRMHRGTLLGWCIGGAVMGFIAGGLGPVVADAVAGNTSLAELIASLVPGAQADIVDIFTAAMLGIAGVLAGAAGVQAVMRLRSEEAEGRAELLLSTTVSNTRWVSASLVVATISVLAVCLVAGLATATALLGSGVGGDTVARVTGAALAHAPAALVFVAATACVFVLVPRLTIALGWGLLVLGLILGQFGDLLRLPEWLQDVSPYRHTSAVPVEEWDAASALVLIAIAIVGGVAAAAFARRRELTV